MSDTADWKVEVVNGPTSDSDYKVEIVGGAAVDLTGATTGDVLTVQSDGSLAPSHPLAHMGAWASGIGYLTNQLVTYLGSTWRARRANVAVTPVEGADWTLFAQGGANGSSELALATLGTSQSSTSTTFADVAGVVVAPNTTSPIMLVIDLAWQIGRNGGADPAANPRLGLQILDDLGNAYLGASGRSIGVSTIAGTGTFQGQNVMNIPITPAAAARTYKLQMKASATTVAVTLWGTDLVAGVPTRLRAVLR